MCICLGKNIARFILVSINIIFFVIGAGHAVIGGIALYNLNWNPQVVVENLKLPIILAISLGCVVAATSAFGWCGAFADKRILLYGYSAIVLILVGLQIYGLIAIRNINLNLKDIVSDVIEKAFTDSKHMEAFHALEASLGCCGTIGPESYEGVYDQLPPTCCMNATTLPDFDEPIVADKDWSELTCLLDDANPGCTGVLLDFLRVIANYVGVAFIVAIAVELLAIVMAISLSCCIASPKTV